MRFPVSRGPLIAAALLWPLLSSAPVRAQTHEPEGGIPVENEAVVENCARCHRQDDSGRMTRISYMRKTPEGWQTSVRRMVTLNDVGLEPEVAREIVRYLANRHGIAPDELRPGRWEAERRMDDYDYEADDDVENTCIQCHSMGRVITQRRSKTEWELLMAMHRGYYPFVDFQAFRYMGPAPGSRDAPEDTRHPMDVAVEHLAEVFPLVTPQWTEWSASMRPARLAGTWAVSADEPGKGPIYGRMLIRAVPGSDGDFTTETTLTYARSGRTVTRSGRSVVFTGYQWRGSSSVAGGDDGLREVMMVDRGWESIDGRWFRGDYDELGIDVTLTRQATSGPTLLGASPRGLRRGASGLEVRVFGLGLPEGLGASDVDFGPGVTVRSVRGAGSQLTAVVDVAANAAVGPRDLFVAGPRRPGAVVVYDQVHSLRVTPEAGMARVGGAVFPKGYVQFEATAYHDGPDGRRGTDDDYDLGIADVTWSLEEYAAVLGDDDLEYVGSIDQTGLFTPALDGPNPERNGERNNIGDVWVVATYEPAGGGRTLRSRAHLLVTVPLYMRWDPWAAGGGRVLP